MYLKVDADSGEEVSNEDVVKGYMLDKDVFIEVSKEELEAIALESTRTSSAGQRRSGLLMAAAK
jgi:DNA end-binding protein Ku